MHLAIALPASNASNPPQKLSGDKNQCPTCHQYFNSTKAFDLHRTGQFGLSGDRRCLSTSQMESIGMRLGASGFWVSKPRQTSPSRIDSEPSPAHLLDDFSGWRYPDRSMTSKRLLEELFMLVLPNGLQPAGGTA